MTITKPHKKKKKEEGGFTQKQRGDHHGNYKDMTNPSHITHTWNYLSIGNKQETVHMHASSSLEKMVLLFRRLFIFFLGFFLLVMLVERIPAGSHRRDRRYLFFYLVLVGMLWVFLRLMLLMLSFQVPSIVLKKKNTLYSY